MRTVNILASHCMLISLWMPCCQYDIQAPLLPLWVTLQIAHPLAYFKNRKTECPFLGFRVKKILDWAKFFTHFHFLFIFLNIFLEHYIDFIEVFCWGLPPPRCTFVSFNAIWSYPFLLKKILMNALNSRGMFQCREKSDSSC